jgi:Glycosyltransferases, probably involved in cell wall biogenesis
MQLGIREYVETMEKRERETIKRLAKRMQKTSCDDAETCAAVKRLTEGLKAAGEALDDKASLEHVSDLVIEAVRDAEFLISRKEVSEIAGAMNELAKEGDTEAAAIYRHIIGNLDSIARRAPSLSDTLPLRGSEEYLEALNLARSEEAVPVQALATISITEDMATAMRLHSLGWKSIFYPEVLAYGLAPEDFGSSLKQRLRWAQGTVQVFIREKSILQKRTFIPPKADVLRHYVLLFFRLLQPRPSSRPDNLFLYGHSPRKFLVRRLLRPLHSLLHHEQDYVPFRRLRDSRVAGRAIQSRHVSIEH